MFVPAAANPAESPDGPCVDAARDAVYCPPDNSFPSAAPKRGGSSGGGGSGGGTIAALVTRQSRVPKAAPRTQPPTPKPRSVLPTTQIDSVKKSCDEIGTSSSSSNNGSSSSSNSSSNSHHQHSTNNAPVASASTSSSSATAATGTAGSGSNNSSSALAAARASAISAAMYANSPRNTLRLIPVDFSLFEDDDFIIDTVPNGDTTTSTMMAGTTLTGSYGSGSSSRAHGSSGIGGGGGRYATLAVTGKRGLGNGTASNGTAASGRVDSTNLVNNENNQNNINTVLRRTTYDLATQCESRRASMRRHTIIGCNQNYKLDHLSSQSMPPSRPASRQSDHGQNQTLPPQQSQSSQPQPQQQQQLDPKSVVVAELVGAGRGSSNISSLDTWTKSSLDENQWKDTFNLNDRLSLTLEEIVHIRSVMTKAELEGLPVDIHIKDDVEKKKVCFLCLRTRFTMFTRGIQCRLCCRMVCNKCNQKMRIPTEHFRNVPVVLLSPSLMNSPCTSNTTSPSHHAHGGGSGPHSLMDESFPRSLMERLLRPELDRKTRNTVGSAPSSPKNQRSASSTPGTSLQGEQPLSLPLSQPATTVTMNGAKESTTTAAANSSRSSVMSRSMEGPHSLPPQSPARPHSNSSTLDRSSRSRFTKAFTLSSAAAGPGSAFDPQKERLTGELMAVCNDCRTLVLEIIRSSRQTRSSAQNQALRNLTLDLSPVYKR